MNVTKTKRMIAAFVLSLGLVGILAGCAAEPASTPGPTSAPKPPSTPEAAVTEYFGYLADKDLDSAINASSSEVVNTIFGGEMIPKEALDKLDPLSGFKIEVMQAGADGATADVSYKIGDERFHTGIRLVKGGSIDKAHWFVDDPLPTLIPQAVEDGVITISGQKITGHVFALPGLYEITVSSPNGFFKKATAKVPLDMGLPETLGKYFADVNKTFNSKWDDAVAAAWDEHAPQVVMEPGIDVDFGYDLGWTAAQSAAENGIENMIRLVKPPKVAQVEYDDAEGWVATLVGGEWERYTDISSERRTFDFRNQGNVVESFHFSSNNGVINVDKLNFAEDPND